MPRYKVNIDGREYSGKYQTPAAAVFGMMLKDLHKNPEASKFTEIAIVLTVLDDAPKSVRRASTHLVKR